MMDTADQNDNKFTIFNQSSTATNFNQNQNQNQNFLNFNNNEKKPFSISTVDDLIPFKEAMNSDPKWGVSWANLSEDLNNNNNNNNNNMKMNSTPWDYLSYHEKIKFSNKSIKQMKKDYVPISNIGGTWGESESPSIRLKTWDNFGTNENLEQQQSKPIEKYWKTSETDDVKDYRAVGGNNIWSNLTTNEPWPKDKTLFPNSDLHEAKHPQKLDSSVELIRSTKQYRLLIGKGFKSENVVTALKNNFLNYDISLECLLAEQNQQFMNLEKNNIPNFVPSRPQQKSIPRRPAPFPIPQTTHPSVDQLKIIVQQIQLAVKDGYLNGQILNQPLAPQTLVLMNKLLLQIRDIHKSEEYLARGGTNSYQLSVNVEKTKKIIRNIQNEIAYHQDLYTKQVLNTKNYQVPRRSNPTMEQSRNQNGPRAVTNCWQGNIPGEYGYEPFQSEFKRQAPISYWAQPNVSVPYAQSTSPLTSIVETAPEFQPGKPWKGGASSFNECHEPMEEKKPINNFLSLGSGTWSYNPDAGLGLPSFGSSNNTDGIKWSNDDLEQSRIPSDVWGISNPADTNYDQ